MARWFLVTLLVACLVFIIQAAPQGETSGKAPESNTDAIRDAVGDFVKSVQDSIDKAMKDPTFQKALEDTKKFVENAAQTVQTEAAKIMPKTDQ